MHDVLGFGPATEIDICWLLGGGPLRKNSGATSSFSPWKPWKALGGGSSRACLPGVQIGRANAFPVVGYPVEEPPPAVSQGTHAPPSPLPPISRYCEILLSTLFLIWVTPTSDMIRPSGA